MSRPTKSARQVFDNELAQAVTEAKLHTPAAKKPQTTYLHVAQAATKDLQRRLAKLVDDFRRMAKSEQQESDRLKAEWIDAQAKAEQAGELSKQWADEDLLSARASQARRKVQELYLAFGRAGQSAGEWQETARQLERLADDVTVQAVMANAMTRVIQHEQAAVGFKRETNTPIVMGPSFASEALAGIDGVETPGERL